MASGAMGAVSRQIEGLFRGEAVAGLQDGQLLAHFRRTNDPAAFEALVARYGPMVLATCRAVLRNEHDAEDAFQATFLVLARKAGSIREFESLGGWLHRVAYRASVQAGHSKRQRERKEAEASAMASSVVFHFNSSSRDDFELRPIVHEEIDRLPEGQRLPIVLCDLEGLTYERAAERLRWTVPTLRSRLAKARQRLRARLARRGITAPAAFPLATVKLATPIMPPALLRATVLAATGGPIPVSAALLTRTLLKGMLMTQIKIAGAALVALSLASAGVLAAAGGQADEPAPRALAVAATPPPPAPKPTPKLSRPGDAVAIAGTVVDPTGRPVVGATVRLGYHLEKSSPEATSGPDGRFSIGVPVSSLRAADTNDYRFPWLVASAPGYGIGHVESVLKPGATSPTIRLVEDGPPIVGQVVDLEGRPVAGARVTSEGVWFEPDGHLDRWLAQARDHGTVGPWKGLMQLEAKVETQADAEGRFRVAGLGRNRLAQLQIAAPSISTAQVYVQTSGAEELHAADREMMGSVEERLFHARQFRHVAAPTRPIVGTVSDQDSNRPLVGWTVRGMVLDESSRVPTQGVEARTDAQGHYQLTGLAQALAYRLFLNPPSGEPYTNGTVVTEAHAPGLDAVPFDIRLKRAVLVRGRVTDKATGRPATGYVDAFAFTDNPHLKEFSSYAESYRAQASLDADGRFEIATLPGHGLLACRSNDQLYRGAEAGSIRAPFVAGNRAFNTQPEFCLIDNYHALAEVDLDPKADSATVDLQVDPGRSLEVAVVDPEGRPTGGTRVSGLHGLFTGSDSPQESATLEVRALAPGSPRRVTVAHEGRKLVGTLYLQGDEAGPLTLRLQPWGAITGRVVDDEGGPRRDIRLMSLRGIQLEHPEVEGILPEDRSGLGGTLVDGDGRFRVERLIPGLNYSASGVRGFQSLGDLFKAITVAPGESKDLGDLKIVPAKQGG